MDKKIIMALCLAAVSGFTTMAAGGERLKTDCGVQLNAAGFTESFGRNAVKAPTFTAVDVNGKRVDLANLRGKVVLLNFWASWCPPCRWEMPAIERLHRQYKNKGLVVVTVNLEDSVTARDFLRVNQLTLTTVSDETEAISQKYGIEALPTTILIDCQGNLAGRLTGAQNYGQLLAAARRAGFNPSQK